MSRRPIAERPTPESTARCSKRSSPAGGRGVGRSRFGDPVDRVGRAGRLEQREPHVVVLLEAHRDLLADVHVVGVAADDVRGEVHAGSSARATLAITYGGSKPGSHGCWFTVKPTTVPRPDTSGGFHDRLRHAGQIGTGGCTSVRAVDAALDPKPAVGARRPEPLVGRGELREGPHDLCSSWSCRECAHGYRNRQANAFVSPRRARPIPMQRPSPPEPPMTAVRMLRTPGRSHGC